MHSGKLCIKTVKKTFKTKNIFLSSSVGIDTAFWLYKEDLSIDKIVGRFCNTWRKHKEATIN